jgi:hypothetical protein
VKAYLALKLMGWPADHPVLVKAREWILAHGGVTECNTFSKIYLCSLGQYDYNAVPAVPPELILFPKWWYFNIYEISAWSRAILVPLSIIYANKPFKKIPPEQGIDELFVGGGPHLPLGGARPHSTAAQDSVEEGGEMAAGAHGDVGRAGRDLSRDVECDCGAGLPGIHPGRSAVHTGDGRI